jgi:hypothetical protein
MGRRVPITRLRNSIVSCSPLRFDLRNRSLLCSSPGPGLKRDTAAFVIMTTLRPLRKPIQFMKTLRQLRIMTIAAGLLAAPAHNAVAQVAIDVFSSARDLGTARSGSLLRTRRSSSRLSQGLHDTVQSLTATQCMMYTAMRRPALPQIARRISQRGGVAVVLGMRRGGLSRPRVLLVMHAPQCER